MYLVTAWTERSTPWASGWKKSGVAQVLSKTTAASWAWATAAIAGTSCISKVSEPGDFEIDRARALAEERLDAGADRGVEIDSIDAHPLQHTLRKAAGRGIDAIGHQELVAGLQAGEKRGGYGREARWAEHCAGGALERRHRQFERLDGRRPAPPIGVALPAMSHVVDGVEKDRRGMDDRWIDEGTGQVLVAAEAHETRRRLVA